MNYREFINRVCADGRDAAQTNYARPDQASKLEGALQGFLEASVTESWEELAALLLDGQIKAEYYREYEQNNYWYWRCREAEIEWCCNVYSAAAINANQAIIIVPTARGMMKAAEIVGAMGI